MEAPSEWSFECPWYRKGMTVEEYEEERKHWYLHHNDPGFKTLYEQRKNQRN